MYAVSEFLHEMQVPQSVVGASLVMEMDGIEFAGGLFPTGLDWLEIVICVKS